MQAAISGLSTPASSLPAVQPSAHGRISERNSPVCFTPTSTGSSQPVHQHTSKQSPSGFFGGSLQSVEDLKSAKSREVRNSRQKWSSRAGRAIECTAAAKDPLLLRVARGEVAERTPVWLMRQAGRYMAAFRKYSDKYPFRMRSETAEIAIELSLQPWTAFATDGVIMFSDILTILPALGIEFDMVKGKGPVIASPVRCSEDLAKLRPLDDPDASLPFIREILSSLRREVEGQSTLLGFVGSPWTLAAYAMEGAAEKSLLKTKSIMFHEPELLHRFLAFLEDALVAYVCHQIDCGAQVVQLFDSWAHHLSPAQFSEFSLPYANRLIRRVRAIHPTTPLIFHANGGTGKIQQMSQNCDGDVIGLDWGTELREAREIFGRARVLQGNVDPMVLFGSEDSIRSAVADCLAAGGPHHHILNVGHGVVQGTPEEAVALFCQLAKESGGAAGEPMGVAPELLRV